MRKCLHQIIIISRNFTNSFSFVCLQICAEICACVSHENFALDPLLDWICPISLLFDCKFWKLLIPPRAYGHLLCYVISFFLFINKSKLSIIRTDYNKRHLSYCKYISLWYSRLHDLWNFIHDFSCIVFHELAFFEATKTRLSQCWRTQNNKRIHGPNIWVLTWRRHHL